MSLNTEIYQYQQYFRILNPGKKINEFQIE